MRGRLCLPDQIWRLALLWILAEAHSQGQNSVGVSYSVYVHKENLTRLSCSRSVGTITIEITDRTIAIILLQLQFCLAIKNVRIISVEMRVMIGATFDIQLMDMDHLSQRRNCTSTSFSFMVLMCYFWACL